MSVETDVLLAPHTTFKIGGPADHFVTVGTVEELIQALHYAKTQKLPIMVLGGGSNVLVSDEGFRGLVIKNSIKGRAVNGMTYDDSVTLTMGSGEVFDEVVAFSVKKGWWGLENLSHIPGSVGATPIQNVGAYGVEISDYVVAVHALHIQTLEEKIFSNVECGFSYRDSFFKTDSGKKYIVTGVTFKLSTLRQPKCEYKDLANRFNDTSAVTLKEIRDSIVEIRSKKFPDWNKVGTAGSFFKNPIILTTQYQTLTKAYPELPGFVVDADHIKIPLGYVLDKICGLRGSRVGLVGCYESQALVIVNYANATAADVNTFVDNISRQVFEKTNIIVEWEVTKV